MRVRATDVADLQKYMLRQAARRRDVPGLTLTPAAIRQLQSYNYPNNIQVMLSFAHPQPGIRHGLYALQLFTSMHVSRSLECSNMFDQVGDG